MLKQMQGTDKRAFPRITVEPSVMVSGGVEGRLANVSEGGICVAASRSIPLKTCSLEIKFPGRDILLNAEIKWCSKIKDEDEFLCGADIFDADEKALAFMRKYMITKQFKYVVASVKNKNDRNHILKFAKHFRDYLFGLIDMREKMKDKKKNHEEEILRQVTEMTDAIVIKGEELKTAISDKKLLDEVKNVFRNLVSSWAFNSKIVYRGFEKPKGYPGDYETLEIIYDKRIVSHKDDLGYFFDVYFLNNPYAKAVRERKNKLREIVEDVLAKEKSPISILNLACGACKEIRDICDSSSKTDLSGKEISFFCLDWDKEALAFSKEQLKNSPKNFHINFMEENVLNFIRRTEFYDKNGKQDLIYSIGLADYFTDRILKTMTKNAFYGLKKGGKFVIAHKDKDISFSHLPPEWFCDWTFYQRNQEDLLALINGVGLDGVKISTDRDVTGDIFFITLTKG